MNNNDDNGWIDITKEHPSVGERVIVTDGLSSVVATYVIDVNISNGEQNFRWIFDHFGLQQDHPTDDNFKVEYWQRLPLPKARTAVII